MFPKNSNFIYHISVRFLTKTAQKPRPDGKHYRLWKMPGDHILRKDILAKQYHMVWHPGLNVGINNDRLLYALCDGIMVITEEKFNPDWNYKLTQTIYKDYDGNEIGVEPFKRYINVIPKRRISEFKLIDLV